MPVTIAFTGGESTTRREGAPRFAEESSGMRVTQFQLGICVFGFKSSCNDAFPGTPLGPAAQGAVA
jgi:hypothetical protein